MRTRHGGRRSMRVWSLLAGAALTAASLAAFSLPAGDAGAVSDYVSLNASLRLVDSRPGAVTSDGQDAGIGRRVAGSTLEVQVAGRAGVPLDASTAVLTIAAVDPLADAFLTVHPTGTARPNASNVNYTAGQNIANTVLARLGTDGKVSIYTFAATHLIVDVSGHLPAGVYTPLPSPQRLADTRPGAPTIDGQQAGIGVLPGGSSLQLHVAGRAGVPADASTAVVTVAAVEPLADAFLTVHPTGTARPNASNVNYSTGQNVANTVLARIGAGGDICIYSHASTHLIVDVAGYFTGPPPPAAGPTCPLPSGAPSGACLLAPPPPADATNWTSVGAEFDGDGLTDVLSTYLVPSEARWHVRVAFGAGGSDDVAIVDSHIATPAQPIGGHDVDGDGTDEAFVRVGSGASTVLVGLYDVAACGLTRVTIGTEPAVFPIGATVGNVSGLACNVVGDLDRLFAQQIAEDVYEGGFEPFTLAGSVLTPGFGDGAGFTAAEAGALATLNCGTLTLPS